jgi:hypothetical protein
MIFENLFYIFWQIFFENLAFVHLRLVWAFETGMGLCPNLAIFYFWDLATLLSISSHNKWERCRSQFGGYCKDMGESINEVMHNQTNLEKMQWGGRGTTML